MFLQAQKGNTYFIELAERVESGNYAKGTNIKVTSAKGHFCACPTLSCVYVHTDRCACHTDQEMHGHTYPGDVKTWLE